MARIRGVEASTHFWQHTATEGWHMDPEYVTVCDIGLPEGAELIGSYHDGNRRTVVLVYHHESFDDVPIGADTPIRDVVYKQIRRDVWLKDHA